MANCELNSKSFDTKLSQHKVNIPKVKRHFFLLVQYCCSLDFGFVPYKTSRQKWFFKLLSFIQCAIVVGISTTMLDGLDFYFYQKICFEYFIYCLFFIRLSSKNSFCQILKDLRTVDKELGVNYHRYDTGIHIIIVYIISCIHKFTNLFMSCYYFKNNFCAFALNLKLFILIPIVSIDFPCIVNVSAYYSVYCRLKSLTEYMRNSEVDIVICQYLYKRLIEITGKCKITSAFTVCLLM